MRKNYFGSMSSLLRTLKAQFKNGFTAEQQSHRNPDNWNNQLLNKCAHFRQNRTWRSSFWNKTKKKIIWLTHRPFPFRPALHFRCGCFLVIDIPWRGTGRRAAERGCPSVFSSMGAFHRSARLSAPPRSRQHCADSSMNVTQLRVTPSSSASGRPRCRACHSHTEWAPSVRAFASAAFTSCVKKVEFPQVQCLATLIR